MKAGSVLIGAATGGAASGNLQGAAAGASVALTATSNNFLKHQQAAAMQKELAACKAKPKGCTTEESDKIFNNYKQLSDQNIAQVQSCIFTGDTQCVSNQLKDAALPGEVTGTVLSSQQEKVLYGREMNAISGSVTGSRGPNTSDVQLAQQVAQFRQSHCADPGSSACDGQVLDAMQKTQLGALKLTGAALAAGPVASALSKGPAAAAAAAQAVRNCAADPVLCANTVAIVTADAAADGAIGTGALGATAGTAKLAHSADQVAQEAKTAKATEEVAAACTTGACFTAGTLVRTAHGLQSIETFKGGELVLSRHERTGLLGYRRVVATKVTHDQELHEIVVRDPDGSTETFHATAEHPFWVVGKGWLKAALLEHGMPLLGCEDQMLRIVSQHKLQQTATVYNIQVDEHSTYHVGTLGVWVHNANCCDLMQQNSIQPATKGNLSKTKLGQEAISLDTPAVMNPAIQDIRINGDITGIKTENLVNKTLEMDPQVTVLPGTKYSGEKGLDHVIQFVDPADGVTKTMVIDSKQLARSGSTNLDPEAAGGTMQLSDSSIRTVLSRLADDSPAKDAIEKALKSGTLVKAVAYLDKVSGELRIVRVTVP
jgi:filamentous hemagglutinin